MLGNTASLCYSSQTSQSSYVVITTIKSMKILLMVLFFALLFFILVVVFCGGVDAGVIGGFAVGFLFCFR